MAIDQPHDGLVRLVFDEPQNAAALIQANLPEKLVALLDWSSLRLDHPSFASSDYDQRHADLLCSIQTHTGRPVCIYVLFEHQSRADPSMPLRMLDTCVKFWQRSYKQLTSKTDKLPIILPLVLAHDESGWHTSTNLRDLFDKADLEEIESAAGRCFVPDFSFLLDDLSTRSDDELRARGATPDAVLACWLLRTARTPVQFRLELPDWASLLEKVLEAVAGQERLSVLLRYITHVVPDVQLDEIYATISEHAPSAEGTIMTIAEQLRAEGKKEGRLEGERRGRLEGERRTLRNQLQRRFGELPSWADEKIDRADSETLDEWSMSVLDAVTLDAVFSDQH